jgi:hypothetical protein
VVLGPRLTPGRRQVSASIRTAIVSYAFWQRELGGYGASAIGRSINLDESPVTVIGVPAA